MKRKTRRIAMNYDKELEERTGIFVFENAFSKELCERTIKAFEDSPNQHKGLTAGGYSGNVKNSIDWHVDNDDIETKLMNVLLLAFDKVRGKYKHLKRFPVHWTGLQVQKSLKNDGYFKPHTDNDESDLEAARWFAPIFYLNDVADGGETEFPFQNYKAKPKAGTLVIFPSTWRYFHQGVKPKSCDKYIITTFGMVPRR